GHLPDLAVEGGGGGRVYAYTALARVRGLVGEHRVGGVSEHVERADEVDPHHRLERLQLVRPVLAGDLLRPAHARAAHADAQATLEPGGGGHGRLDLGFVGDVGRHELGTLA